MCMVPFQITLNGESRTVVSSSVSALLEELQLAGKKVAVERNREIVRRDDYAAVELAAGDQIEIIHFVGGG